MAKKENTTSIGFEEIIWRAADKLRGNLSASEYEGVVLGLIFLKYISDKFEAKLRNCKRMSMQILKIKTSMKEQKKDVYSLFHKVLAGVIFFRRHILLRLEKL